MGRALGEKVSARRRKIRLIHDQALALIQVSRPENHPYRKINNRSTFPDMAGRFFMEWALGDGSLAAALLQGQSNTKPPCKSCRPL